MPTEKEILAGSRVTVESLIFLEARPCAGESDEEIVAGAWDFPAINRRYAQHRKVHNERPAGAIRDATDAAAFRNWADAERLAWLAAVTPDPLLPAALLPADYPGRNIWRERINILRLAAEQMRAFVP